MKTGGHARNTRILKTRCDGVQQHYWVSPTPEVGQRVAKRLTDQLASGSRPPHEKMLARSAEQLADHWATMVDRRQEKGAVKDAFARTPDPVLRQIVPRMISQLNEDGGTRVLEMLADRYQTTTPDWVATLAVDLLPYRYFSRNFDGVFERLMKPVNSEAVLDVWRRRVESLSRLTRDVAFAYLEKVAQIVPDPQRRREYITPVLQRLRSIETPLIKDLLQSIAKLPPDMAAPLFEPLLLQPDEQRAADVLRWVGSMLAASPSMIRNPDYADMLARVVPQLIRHYDAGVWWEAVWLMDVLVAHLGSLPEWVDDRLMPILEERARWIARENYRKFVANLLRAIKVRKIKAAHQRRRQEGVQ